MIKYKSVKGITLIELSIYIIILLIVVGLLTSLRNYFYGNIGIIRDTARYASSFDKFNSYFVEDVKSNKQANIESSGNNMIITFENGSTYVFNDNDNSIYKGKIKIADNVSVFNASKKTIIINNVEKEIISINIVIGTSSNTLFSKTIDYTLKYW